MRLRTWAEEVAVASLLGLAAYLALTAGSLSPGDRSALGVSWIDARPLYLGVAAVGVAAAFIPAARPWWVALMPLVTVGRAASLVFLGSPDLVRIAEYRAAAGWLLLSALGILSVLVLEAANVIRGIPGE